MKKLFTTTALVMSLAMPSLALAQTATPPATAPAETDHTAFTGPDMEREGYNRVEMTEIPSEMIVGSTVYDVNEESTGRIDDLVLDDSGQITNVIINFGGFLGLGATQVAIGFDELTVLANEDRSDVRVYVDATKEQIEAMPEYQAPD